MGRLINHVGLAGNSPWKTYRGYAKPLLEHGLYEFLATHRQYEMRFPSLDLMLWMPGGRDRELAFWKNGGTSQRSDQIKRAAQDQRGRAILTGIKNFTVPGRTRLYIGGHPEMVTFGDIALWPWIRMGFGVVFDAMSSQQLSLSSLSVESQRAHKNGYRIWTESNSASRLTGDVPIVAAVADWELADRRPELRTPMHLAPKGSAWWWRSTERDGVWSLDTAKRAVGAGLDLIVNLDELPSESVREALFTLMTPKAGN